MSQSQSLILNEKQELIMRILYNTDLMSRQKLIAFISKFCDKRILKRMERNGLIESRPNLGDMRSVYIRLTDNGREIMENEYYG